MTPGYSANGATPIPEDPLTLDLDGDGIETSETNDGNRVMFDYDGDGVKTNTGWVNGDDGILVLDRNGNGVIDDGRELFGDNTIKKNGQKAKDGVDALKDYDSNGDGKFGKSDAVFNQVKVWRDINQDGVSQRDELFTLNQLNILSINSSLNGT